MFRYLMRPFKKAKAERVALTQKQIAERFTEKDIALMSLLYRKTQTGELRWDREIYADWSPTFGSTVDIEYNLKFDGLDFMLTQERGYKLHIIGSEQYQNSTIEDAMIYENGVNVVYRPLQDLYVLVQDIDEKNTVKATHYTHKELVEVATQKVLDS